MEDLALTFFGMLTSAKALMEDQMTDDTPVVYDLVEAVRSLFFMHAELAQMRSHEKGYQRKWECINACRIYAELPFERHRLKVFSSWANLCVRERQQFRSALRCSDLVKRNKMLLELAGTKVLSERTSADAPKDGTEGCDITLRQNPRLQPRRHRVALGPCHELGACGP